MSVKLFIPAVGAVGTIASVAGVSSSSQRSNSSADTTPTHKWKIEVPENIDMVFDCTGKMVGGDLTPGSLISAKLELTVLLERGEDVRLFKGETLSKELFVGFRKKEDDRKLWPVLMSKRRERILIEASPSGKTLTVKYGQWNDRVSMIDGGKIRGMACDCVDSTFSCS